MKEITVEALREWQSKGELAQLIDVREPHEFDDLEMGGTLIPMGQVPARMNEISKEGKVVIQCRSGARSANVIQYLEQHGYNNLYNLKGGILAWLASH